MRTSEIGGRLFIKGEKLSDDVIVIGVKGKPSPRQIADTIAHELAHIKSNTPNVAPNGNGAYQVALDELAAYKIEKDIRPAREWNDVLPIRIRDFKNYISWLTTKEQERIKSDAMTVLDSKPGGGNFERINKARSSLGKFWLIEIPVKPVVEAVLFAFG